MIPTLIACDSRPDSACRSYNYFCTTYHITLQSWCTSPRIQLYFSMGKHNTVAASPSKVLRARIMAAKADQSAKKAKAAKTAQAKATKMAKAPKASKQKAKENANPSEPDAEPADKTAVTLA